MESKLIVWSLNQLKIGLWGDMRLLFGNTEVQNQWKYWYFGLCKQSPHLFTICIFIVFPWLSKATDTTAMKRPGNTNDKIRNLS